MRKGRTAKRSRTGVEENLRRFGISLPAELLKKFDAHLEKKNQRNRSLALADLIRDDLVEEEWADGKGEQVATITLLYDPQNADLARRLGESKRALASALMSSLLTRLDAHRALEVLVLCGVPATLRTQAEGIMGLKGILHGKMVMTTGAGV